MYKFRFQNVIIVLTIGITLLIVLMCRRQQMEENSEDYAQDGTAYIVMELKDGIAIEMEEITLQDIYDQVKKTKGSE